MIRAKVLIQVNRGKAAPVAGDRVEVEGKIAAERVTGPGDMVPLAEARNLHELNRRVIGGFQGITDVIRTLTCTVVRP